MAFKLENGLTDLGATGETGAFVHREDGGCDVAVDDGTTGEVAAIAVHIAIYMSEDLDISWSWRGVWRPGS